jgi:hypothetical protein
MDLCYFLSEGQLSFWPILWAMNCIEAFVRIAEVIGFSPVDSNERKCNTQNNINMFTFM